MARKKMGEILVENNVISKDDLDQALLRQKGVNKPIGKILEDMDVILEEDIAKALSKQFGFPYVKRFSRHNFSKTILNQIDAETALSQLIFPLKIDKKTLYLAMSNPLDMALQNDLSFKLAMRISPCVSTPEEIKAAIKKHYLGGEDLDIDEDDEVINILLVDNQEITLTAAETALLQDGYAVYKARNGAEGLKIAVQLHPDLIVTEIVMPRLDGIEMFKALQKNGEIEHIPVIALSSKSKAEDEAALLELGFYDFIAKPINPIRLSARVKRALKQHNK